MNNIKVTRFPHSTTVTGLFRLLDTQFMTISLSWFGFQVMDKIVSDKNDRWAATHRQRRVSQRDILFPDMSPTVATWAPGRFKDYSMRNWPL